VHAAELGAVLECRDMAAEMPAQCARTLDSDVDLLIMARLALDVAEEVVLGAVDLVKTIRAPLGQVGVRGRTLVEMARACGEGIIEVNRVEGLIAVVAGPQGGAPGIPGLVQHVRTAELKAPRINSGIF